MAARGRSLPPLDQRGNVVMVTMIVVLSIVGLGLSLNILLRTRVGQEFDLRTIGDVPTQARYVAEAGINQLVFNANNSALTSVDLTSPTCGSTCTLDNSNKYFPKPALENTVLTGTYSLVVTPTATGADVVATSTLVSTLSTANKLFGGETNHQRIIKASLLAPGAGNPRWRVSPGSWRELP